MWGDATLDLRVSCKPDDLARTMVGTRRLDLSEILAMAEEAYAEQVTEAVIGIAPGQMTAGGERFEPADAWIMIADLERPDIRVARPATGHDAVEADVHVSSGGSRRHCLSRRHANTIQARDRLANERGQ